MGIRRVWESASAGVSWAVRATALLLSVALSGCVSSVPVLRVRGGISLAVIRFWIHTGWASGPMHRLLEGTRRG
jgi:hypothetical protein